MVSLAAKKIALVMLGLAALTCFDLPPSALGGTHFVVGCTILDESRNVVKSFPGTLCVFLPDGSHVRSQGESLVTRVGQKGQVLWERKLSLHHQLNLSADGRRLITLSKDERRSPHCSVSYESFLVLDVATGKTLSRWSAEDHLGVVLQMGSRYSRDRAIRLGVYTVMPSRMESCEFTHFNSITEIPANSLEQVVPAFRRGNFLAHFFRLGTIAILDPGLKRILWATEVDFPQMVHDAQVLQSGEILVHQNARWDDSPDNDFTRMSLQRFDPLTGVTTWRFPMKDDPAFRIPGITGGGGVQVTPEGVLFNLNRLDLGGVAYLVGEDGTLRWKASGPYRMSDGLPHSFQQIKQHDLSSFLERNKL